MSCMIWVRRRRRYRPNAMSIMPNSDSKNGSNMSGDRPESVRKITGVEKPWKRYIKRLMLLN